VGLNQLLADERGKLSTARVLLVCCLIFTGVIILFDSVLWGEVPNSAYALLGTIFTGLLAWTAGPRIAQYLGPQIGAVAKGIGSAVAREPRRPEVMDNHPDFQEHDEK
jgi:hypothetical protein